MIAVMLIIMTTSQNCNFDNAQILAFDCLENTNDQTDCAIYAQCIDTWANDKYIYLYECNISNISENKINFNILYIS